MPCYAILRCKHATAKLITIQLRHAMPDSGQSLERWLWGRDTRSGTASCILNRVATLGKSKPPRLRPEKPHSLGQGLESQFVEYSTRTLAQSQPQPPPSPAPPRSEQPTPTAGSTSSCSGPGWATSEQRLVSASEGSSRKDPKVLLPTRSDMFGWHRDSGLSVFL